MKNIIWKKEDGEWVLYRKYPEFYICAFDKKDGKYFLPTRWFGRTKKYNRYYRKSLASAKAACEKWLSDFIKSMG